MLRIDRSLDTGVNDDSLLGFLDQLGATSYFGVLEKEETNPHYHFFVECYKSLNAARNTLKRYFPRLKGGNKDYSMKTIVEDKLPGYLVYLCKGSARGEMPDVRFHKNLEFTEAEVFAWHQEYWDQNDVIQAIIAANSKKLLVRVQELCEVRNIRADQPRAIFDVIYEVQVERAKPLAHLQVQSVLLTVQMHLDTTGHYKNAFFNALKIPASGSEEVHVPGMQLPNVPMEI